MEAIYDGQSLQEAKIGGLVYTLWKVMHVPPDGAMVNALILFLFTPKKFNNDYSTLRHRLII